MNGPERKRLVVGFLFQGTSVLLVQKNKPEWQKGLWNGVGGRCEGEELATDAMAREFEEETGIPITWQDWTHFCTEIGDDYVLYCFYCIRLGLEEAVPQVNDIGEKLQWRTVRLVIESKQIIGNLHWLVPLAQDWRSMSPIEVWVGDDIRERPSW